MGCECIKPEEMAYEIITSNIEEKDNYFLTKNEKRKDIDTNINTLTTSDKNTFITNKYNDIVNYLKKTNNKDLFPSEQNSQKINTSNNSKEEELKQTMDNVIKDSYNNKYIKREIKKQSKTLTNNKAIKNNISFDKNKSKTKIFEKSKNKPKNESQTKVPPDEFSKYIFEQINKLREDPQSFIKDIEEAKSYISRNKHNKLIYKKKVKVLLSQGLLAFEEAISILQKCKPMEKLIFEPSLLVNLPKTEEDIVNKKYFKNEIKKMIDKGIPIQTYWRDIINDPETSFLMMVVDDTGLKAGLKRKDILDPNKKYIGISSTNIGKHFVCFLTFSNLKH